MVALVLWAGCAAPRNKKREREGERWTCHRATVMERRDFKSLLVDTCTFTLHMVDHGGSWLVIIFPIDIAI